jgi:cell wall-associated NlpC family hydrolase
MSIVGTPYIWGGEGPDGYDCSGLVQEILASVGAEPRYDKTAQGLYNYYKESGQILTDTIEPGALTFYGRDINHITHVGFAIDHFRMVEAGNGGPKVQTIDDACLYHAYVRIRPILKRGDFLVAILPAYELF